MPRGVEGGDGAVGDGHEPQVAVADSHGEGHVEVDGVEVEADASSYRVEGFWVIGLAAQEGAFHSGGIGRAAEPVGLPRPRRSVHGAVKGFEDRDAPDVAAHRSGGEGERGYEHRVHPGAYKSRATGNGGGAEAFAGVAGVVLAVDETGGGDNVGASSEDALELGNVRPMGHVDDAVGTKGEKRVDVLGDCDTDRAATSYDPGVLSDLVGAVGEDADQLEAGVIEDRSQRGAAHDAGRPLHDSDLGRCHRISSGVGCG